MADGSVPAAIDVLRARPWKRALFTTYALSLSFFETEVLHALTSAGDSDLDEIWIVTDASGYRSSLMERRAVSVGQVYRLVPAALPQGVFHPKLTYLSGPEGDLLLVGSGNLTFGGYGRNAEVLEVLTPDAVPTVFLDFAEFLESIPERPDLLLPQQEWIRTFARLAREAAAPFETQAPSLNTRLLHSLRQPVVQQLERRASEVGPVRRLTVLSPFHDPDGKAVLGLASRLGVSQLRVGLPPDPSELSTFPFSRKAPKGLRVSAVRPVVSHPKRPLHAKWIEIEGQRGALTLTGSVNATTKSLCGTDNVEVGVLRHASRAPAWAEWKTVPTPEASRVQNFRSAGLGSAAVVYATLFSNGWLEGALVHLGDKAGKWDATLSHGRGAEATVSIDVAADGSFRFRPRRVEVIASASAIQLTLKRAGVEARGWVQNDELLRMTRVPGLGTGAIVRLGSAEEMESDVIALLKGLALNGGRYFAAFIPSAVASGSVAHHPKKDGQTLSTVKVSDLAPNPEVVEGDDAWGGAAGFSPDEVLHRALLTFRSRVVGAPSTLGLEASTPSVEDEAEEEAGDGHGGGVHVARRLPEALHAFDASMREIVTDELTSDTAKRGVLSMWLEVKLHVLIRREMDYDGTITFLIDWLALATSTTSAVSPPAALEEHVVGVAGVVAALDPDGRDGYRLARLHENLERFCGGDIGMAGMTSLLRERMPPVLRAVADRQEADPLAAFDAMLERKTLRQQLVDVLEQHRQGREVLDDAVAFAGEAGPPLLRMLRLPPGKARIRELRDDRWVCPACFSTLSDRAAQSLRLHRVGRCSANCGCMIVRTKP